jgi:hypothetical protein
LTATVLSKRVRGRLRPYRLRQAARGFHRLPAPPDDKIYFNYLSYALASRSLLAQKTRSNSQQPSANLWETRTWFTKWRKPLRQLNSNTKEPKNLKS